MMIKTIFIFVFFMILGMTALPASARIRVYLFAGQSNMGGIGLDSELVGDLAKYSGVNDDLKIWNYADTPHQWCSFSSTSRWFGPELGFGYKMQELYPHDEIYMIKCSWGSTNLYNDWNSSEPGGAWYNNFRSTVHEALSYLENPTIDGMLWMQGEGDAADPDPDNAVIFSQAYQENLTALINNVRTEFATPDLPFVLGRILYDWGTSENNAMVRAAQETVPGLVGDAAWVNTDDLQISSAIPLHYGTEGTIDLGLRFADEMVNIPEPATLSLLSLAIFGLFNRRKNR